MPNETDEVCAFSSFFFFLLSLNRGHLSFLFCFSQYAIDLINSCIGRVRLRDLFPATRSRARKISLLFFYVCMCIIARLFLVWGSSRFIVDWNSSLDRILRDRHPISVQLSLKIATPGSVRFDRVNGSLERKKNIEAILYYYTQSVKLHVKRKWQVRSLHTMYLAITISLILKRHAALIFFLFHPPVSRQYPPTLRYARFHSIYIIF